jgi:hypothetical protein
MQIRSLKSLVAALILLSPAAHAQWSLDGAASSFYYVTSKASAVSEVNTFGGLSGGITDAGTASLVLDLATVNTAIEIRDQRMRDIVFQVATFPSASVSASVDSAELDSMRPGMTVTGSYTATVDLHGMSQQLAADLQIVKLDASTLQVQLARPLLVGAGLFGLAEGVEQLREIAGLPAINPNVVVDFTLLYRKQ